MLNNKTSGLFGLLLLVLISSCQNKPAVNSPLNDRLPYLGNHDLDINQDTLYYRVPKFSFLNQDSLIVSHQDYLGHIYVVDFFFSTCPSICPVMTGEMARLQNKLKDQQLFGDVKLLSHTVNPSYDTPRRLKEYGEMMGADFSNWNFVTGSTEDLYYQAELGYMMTAFPSDTAQGGFFHSDNFVLVDREFHIRGIYDGTSTDSVDQLYQDILKLIKE